MALTEEQKAKKRAYYRANKERVMYTSQLGVARTFLGKYSNIKDLVDMRDLIKEELDKTVDNKA